MQKLRILLVIAVLAIIVANIGALIFLFQANPESPDLAITYSRAKKALFLVLAFLGCTGLIIVALVKRDSR